MITCAASQFSSYSIAKMPNTAPPGFRRELMHPNSNRAGTLYLDGCTAVDLLPR